MAALTIPAQVPDGICDPDMPDHDPTDDDHILHRYSSQLPLSYRLALQSEQKILIHALHVLVNSILTSQEACPSSHSDPSPSLEISEDTPLPLVAEGYENEFERDYAAFEKGLNRYLDLKYPVEPPDFPFFINALMRGFLSPSVDMGLRAKLARAASRLLQKRQCHLPDGVPWRLLMDLIVKYHIDCVTGGPFIGKDLRDAHCRNMVSLMACSRNFLVPGDTAEVIWNHFLPTLAQTPDVDARFQELLFLVQVLPTRGDAWSGWMDQGMEIWQSIESSSEWDGTWMSIMGRLAKHQPCAHDWTPHLPLVYGRLTASLHLPLGAIAPQSAADRRPPHHCLFLLSSKPIASAAALIVFTLSPKHPETLEYLERLFALIANYFHPSNSGRWSHTIGNFLIHITVNLVVRVIEERRATKAGVLGRVLGSILDRPVAPMEDRLSEEYSERLVKLLQPLIQHGLHSKVSSMSVQAASSARDLAIIAPHVVIEPFLMEASDGLESISSPHRTIAALRLLSTITSVFLDTDFFPNGADFLPQVMMLTLPGIDPNDMSKTESTLKFVAATAGRLQSIVAAEPKGSIAYFLEEYVHQFLERVFALLESLEAPPKKSRNGTYPDACVQLSYFIFAVTVENLFGCLPEQLAVSAAQRISRQISGAACLNAKKYYGVLVRTACAAVASVTNRTSAGMFVPMLLDQILEPTGCPGGDFTLVSVAEDELVWRIRMLAQACRCCGPGVIQYLEKISCVVRLSMDKPSRPIYKAGGRLLRGVLEGLCAVQIKFGPGRGSKEDSFADGELYSFEWNEPTPAEWKAAEDFMISCMVLAEELAHEKEDTDGPRKIIGDRDVLFRVLRLLHAIQRGGRWLLAGALPDHFKVLDKFVDSGLEMSKYEAILALKRPVPAGLGGERNTPASDFAIKFWSRVYSLITKIMTFVVTTRPDDGTLLYRCLEPIELAHEPFRRGQKSRQPMHTARAYKAVYKPIVASKRPFGSAGGVGRAMPRFVLKHRIEAQHEMRLSISARAGLCCRDIFDNLIGLLTDLSINDFPRVRGEARGVLTRSLRVAPPHVRRREICRVIEVLEKSASGVAESNNSAAPRDVHGEQISGVNGIVPSGVDDPMVIDTTAEADPEKPKGDILYDKMIGAAAVLRSSAAAPIIMRDWNLLSIVIKALLDAMLAAVRPDAGMYVGFLFSKLSSLVRPLRLDPIRLIGSDLKTEPSISITPTDAAETARREDILNSLNCYLLSMLNRTSESLKLDQGNKKEAHWRLQSLVATVLYIILREDRPPPPNVAQFFIDSMASDVVTLRQVSSKAVMGILAVHGRRAEVAHEDSNFDDSPAAWDSAGKTALSVIGRKMSSKSFAKSVIHTLALDHDGDAGDGGHRSRNAAVGNVGGSIAIMNISRSMDGDACWMLAGGRPWPSSWIPKSRDSLNLVRMRLYESFIRVYGRHVLQSFLPIASDLIRKAQAKQEKIIDGVKDEDVRVLAGEVLAAICRGLDMFHCTDGATYEVIENLAISLLSDMTGRLGNVTGGTIIRLIGTADTFTIGRRVWKGILNWLLRKKPIIVQMGDGPVAHLQARRLRYIHACIADVDESKHDSLVLFVNETLAALTGHVGFDHELKTVREEVAKCLSLIAVFLPEELDGAFNERITLLCERLALASNAADETSKEVDETLMEIDNVEDEKRKSRSRQGETLSRFVSIVEWGGNAVLFEKYMAKVLPAVFSSFDESDPERIAHSRMSLSLCAQGRYSRSTIDDIVLTAQETIKDPRWKVRSAVLAFLQVFSFASLFIATPKSLEQIRNTVVKLLSDSQLEVRQAAAAAFVTMIRDATPEAVSEVRVICLKVLKKTTPKRRGTKREALSPETLCRRHGAVLGLSSMITSSPYSVPEWMPSVLVALSGCVNDPPPISTGVRKLFADFMRTHRDEWQMHKLSFSEDELEIVSELLVSPSYYA